MNFTQLFNLYKWDKQDKKIDTITEMANNVQKIEDKFSSVETSLADNAKQLTDRVVSAKDKQFGAIGDGITDDTVALQSFVTYVTNNHLNGIIPAGNYKITATLNVAKGAGWKIVGAGFAVTNIVQYTNNIPIFNLGYDATANVCHSVQLSDMCLYYNTGQTTSYPSGNAILISEMYYECTFKRLRLGGYYGIKVKSGVGGPWGCVFDELVFLGSCYGGAMDWTGAVNAIPNNRFGRMFIDGVNMVGPIFNNIQGYNWTIELLEFINTQQGAQLLNFQAGAKCIIESLKLENGNYTAQQVLINMGAGSKVKIGQINIGGNNMLFAPSSGNIRLIKTDSGGATGWLEVDFVELAATTLTGSVYILEGNTGSMIIKHLVMDAKNWQLTNITGAASCETVSIESWNNNRLSSNKGDADYTVVLGDPNNISFETALTASRAVNLPGTNANLFNGLKYRVRSYGAVNGTNVINVVCNGVTKATLSSDKTVVELMYRRNASNAQSGWTVVGYNTLP
jgi:hypothetical protein